MPWKPASPCTTPGCPNLNPCPDHPRTTWPNAKQRRRNQGATLTTSQEAARRRRIMQRHRSICHVCHEPFADQIDHVIPLAEQGPDTDNNLRPIHAIPCHADKTEAERRRGLDRSRGQ